MAANTNPIYSLVANFDGVIPTAVNTSSQGGGTIGTDIFKAFTASTEGAWVDEVRCFATASVAATATAATVLRVFVSTQGSGATTSANTRLIAEVSAPVTTAAHSTNATTPLIIPINKAIEGTNTILITTHVANAANTGWQCTVFGGDF